ncbi:MAG: hypothetical protein NTX14_03750 [Candidatus Nealsonbacteria bacterium]|nr:hypothetical protein [Candidatus Nealsonbacteria bacterium]
MKKTKIAVYALLTSAAIILGTMVYWFQYYNIFSIQEWTNNFIDVVEGIFFGGFYFALWSLGGFSPGSIALCAAASAAILAFFWIVETKLFKDKKWAFLTAPLITSALLLAFALGGSIVSNLIVTDLSNTKLSSGCMDIFYGNTSFDSSIMLASAFSMLILEAACAAFLLLILYGAIKKKGWNKFLVVSVLLLILAQLIYYLVLPLVLRSLVLN